MTYLDKILAQKPEDIAAAKRKVSLADLKSMTRDARRALPFAQSIVERNGIIAEFKRKSPSKGEIHHKPITPSEVVFDYAEAGVSAISCLTDPNFFGGSIDDLREATEAPIPVLRKEFIIDEYQVWEARANGASAMLLIAACLERNQAEDLAGLAKQIGLEVMMELHNEDEVGYILPGVTVAGINNRDLRTFDVDLQHSIQTAHLLPSNLPKISESGIRTIDDMLLLRGGGFNGFLIGENFMKESNPGAACKAFCKQYTDALQHHGN